MKLPVKPTQPYLRHSAHTLMDVKNRRHGNALDGRGAADRPATMRSRSAALTWGMSSGRLRNQGQKRAHQSRPKPAMSNRGVSQSPKNINSQSKSNGASAPPSRLNVQSKP